MPAKAPDTLPDEVVLDFRYLPNIISPKAAPLLFSLLSGAGVYGPDDPQYVEPKRYHLQPGAQGCGKTNDNTTIALALMGLLPDFRQAFFKKWFQGYSNVGYWDLLRDVLERVGYGTLGAPDCLVSYNGGTHKLSWAPWFQEMLRSSDDPARRAISENCIDFLGLDDAAKKHGGSWDAVWSDEETDFNAKDWEIRKASVRRNEDTPGMKDRGFLVTSYNRRGDPNGHTRVKLEETSDQYLRDNMEITVWYLSDRCGISPETVSRREKELVPGTPGHSTYFQVKWGSREGLIYDPERVHDMPAVMPPTDAKERKAWTLPEGTYSLDPDDYKMAGWGLDWGHTNQTAAILQGVDEAGDIFVLYELVVAGVDDQTFRDMLRYDARTGKFPASALKLLMVADTDKTRIDNWRADGFKMVAANAMGRSKGPGSILAGIDLLQQRHQYFYRVLHPISLQQTQDYHWAEDENGNTIRLAVKVNEHSCDARRYWASFNLARDTGLPDIGGNLR